MTEHQPEMNHTNDLDGLFAQIDELSEREEKLRERLNRADEQWRAHERQVQVKIEQLAARVANASSGPGLAVPRNGQRATNDHLAYRELIGRIREVVNATLPPESTVIVVSKGDAELVKLDGRTAWHFPQNEKGVYAGYYPSDSADAIRQLENLRVRGGEYLLFPSTAFWWLDHYREFSAHLRQYREIVRRDDVGVIFSLRERTEGKSRASRKTARRTSVKVKRNSRGK